MATTTLTMDGEQGLKRRQTYEEVIEYIESDPDKIVYPDRSAKFLRNSFELGFLDTHNYEVMIEQQKI